MSGCCCGGSSGLAEVIGAGEPLLEIVDPTVANKSGDVAPAPGYTYKPHPIFEQAAESVARLGGFRVLAVLGLIVALAAFGGAMVARAVK